MRRPSSDAIAPAPEARPRRARRRLTCGGVVAATLLALAACNAPTLPLPPPQALVSPPENDGTVLIEGSVLPEAWVFCINNDTDVGVAARADEAGAFQLRIAAEEGHYLSLWQQVGADIGPSVDLLVPMRR